MSKCSKCGKVQRWGQMYGPIFIQSKCQCQECWFKGREEDLFGLDVVNEKKIKKLTKRIEILETQFHGLPSKGVKQ